MTFESFARELADKSRENMKVYMDVLIDLAMIARNLSDESVIDIDFSPEMYGMLRNLADEFMRGYCSADVPDKAAHIGMLRAWAEKKLIEAFAPKGTYRVDISYLDVGHIYVEASSEEEAVILAKREIEEHGRDAVEPDEECDVEPDDIQCINEVCCID